MAKIIASSDITGQDIGTFTTMKAAWAAVRAYDIPGRKAAHTKRLAGTHIVAGRKAAATKARNADAAAGPIWSDAWTR